MFIDSRTPAGQLQVPAAGAIAQAFTSGPGNANVGGKSTICIKVLDTSGATLNLGWNPPVRLGGGSFVNIGAEKPGDTGYDDVAVTVYWKG